MKFFRRFLPLLLLLALAPGAWADSIWTYYNSDSSYSGYWNYSGFGSNWNGGIPNSSTYAIINNGGRAELSSSDPQGGGLGYYSKLDVGTTSGGGGELDVYSGALLSGTTADLGASAGGYGYVYVDGTGAQWTNSGYLLVGASGTGYLSIYAGGKVTSGGGGKYSVLGNDAGSTGTVDVNGTGQWTINDDLYVGGGGNGMLYIEDGSKVTDAHASIANSGTSTSTVTVTGANSLWSSSGQLIVGNVGKGTLYVQNGGKVTNTTGYIAEDSRGTGSATVDGNGSQWINSSELYIAESGEGTLTIQNSGTVSNTNGVIGDGGATGTVTVTGSGSQWSSIGILHVGGHGTGTLNIQSGGKVSVTGDSTIGHGSDATGHATVDGAGSQWNLTGQLRAGEAGTGTLSILNGGAVSSASGRVGAITGGVGVVTVSGAGSLWTTGSGMLTVGDAGTGTVTLDTAGKVTAASVIMASSGSAKGTLNLNGTSGSRGVLETASFSKGGGTGGATINFNGGILRATADSSNFLQGFGASDVQVQSGGAFIDTNGHNVTVNSTVQFNGTGGITKQGAGALTLSGDRAYYGDNFVIAGTLSNNSGSLGYNSGNTSTMTVAGTGSQWNNSGQLRVGYSGNGTLNIQSGGTVSNGDSYLGFNSGSTGTATVGGAGSAWNLVGFDLLAGLFGSGTLNIQSGGTVTSGGGYLGYNSGSTGVATVSGTGSTWNVASDLVVGSSGSGTLTVDAGGKAVTPNVTLADFGTGSTGTLDLNGSAGSRGVLETTSVSKGTGTGGATVNFNGGILRATASQADFFQSFATGYVQIQSGGAYVDTQGYNVGIGTALQGAGGLTKQGSGKLTLSGAGTFTGATTVEAGKLEITGSLTSDVTVQSGAMLAGTGTVKQVIVSGSISPGASGAASGSYVGYVGTLHTQGETWNGGVLYAWDVNAASSGGTAGTNWDFIDTAGTLNLAATSGSKFTLDINGSANGLAIGTNYDWTILTASGGFGGTFAPDKFAFDTTDFSSNTSGDFSVLTSGNNLVLRYSATPEPAGAVLLLFGTTLLAARRRR